MMKLHEMIRAYIKEESLNREALSSLHKYMEDNNICPHQERGMSESHAEGDIVGMFVALVSLHKHGWPDDLHDVLFGG